MEHMEPRAGMGLVTNEEKQMGMFLHLSQLLNLIIPFGGVIAPIVIWQMKKEEMPALDRHGKIVVNWFISSIIYWFVSIILAFFLIGIPLLFILFLVSIVYPIIGGVKANNGEDWNYPGAIPFLK